MKFGGAGRKNSSVTLGSGYLFLPLKLVVLIFRRSQGIPSFQGPAFKAW